MPDRDSSPINRSLHTPAYSLLKDIQQGSVRWHDCIILIENQWRAQFSFLVLWNPGVFVREAPGLESCAAGMTQASRGDKPVDVCLLHQVRLIQNRPARICRQPDIHLRDMNLKTERRQACDVVVQRLDVSGAQMKAVHL